MTTAQHLIHRAARYASASARSLWPVAMAARRIVGQYEAGATLQLADAIQRSPDTVELYARAGFLLAAFRQHLPGHSRSIREARNRLPPSHWYRVQRVWRREEFPLRQALLYLLLSMRGHCNERQLEMALDADYPAPTRRPDVLPVFGIQDDQIERLRAEMPGAFVLILPLVDDWQKGDMARVVKVRKAK